MFVNTQHIREEQVSSPPRSRLHRLEPIGIGTPWSESLTGYVIRLAEAHDVTPKQLIMQEVLPLQGRAGTTPNHYYRLNKFWIESALSLNGISPVASEWVETLQTLTSCGNLRYLTMLTWKEVTTFGPLLRRSKAWCPLCYKEWLQAGQIIYEPLLWALNGVDVCYKHHLPLATVCPNCRIPQPFVTQRSLPGHCSGCVHWLGGLPTEEQERAVVSDVEGQKQQLWRVEVVGELLAAAPSLVCPPSVTQITTVLQQCLEQYAHGNHSIFARLLGMPAQNLWDYLKKGGVPHFDTFLRVCETLKLRPLEFFTSESLQSRHPSWFVLDNLPFISRGKRKRVTQEDVKRMRQALERVLAENVDPPPTLKQIAERLGYVQETLHKHCPDQCQAIVALYRGKLTSDKEQAQVKQALEAALTSEEIVSLGEIAMHLRYHNASLSRLFPELCQAIMVRYNTRFDDERMRTQLQSVLSSSEPTPSLAALVRQLGCTRSILQDKFPDLCKELIERRRTERRKRHEERVSRICAEVRQAVLVIHQQGRYPSARQIAKLLSDPQTMRMKEVQNAWRTSLAELALE